jgi:hypothetical protein
VDDSSRVFPNRCEVVQTIGNHTHPFVTDTMIARGKILQLAMAAFAAYAVFTVLVTHTGGKAWPSSLPRLSQSSVNGGVFEKIRNHTLGVCFK